MTIDASSAGSINLRLKLCAQWSDVAKVIDDFGDSLGASNVAYALFRLGCLYCFMSVQRKEALERSGMLEALLKRTSDKVASFCASDVTFALDGMARLRMQPETPLLDALADKVHLSFTACLSHATQSAPACCLQKALVLQNGAKMGESALPGERPQVP